MVERYNRGASPVSLRHLFFQHHARRIHAQELVDDVVHLFGYRTDADRAGGYCAWAAAKDKLAPGDPTVYKVVDNKLYLNVNQEVAARWEKDIPGLIRAADANWPKLGK